MLCDPSVKVKRPQSGVLCKTNGYKGFHKYTVEGRCFVIKDFLFFPNYPRVLKLLRLSFNVCKKKIDTLKYYKYYTDKRFERFGPSPSNTLFVRDFV